MESKKGLRFGKKLLTVPEEDFSRIDPQYAAVFAPWLGPDTLENNGFALDGSLS